jgi:hypothetical protein
MACHPGGQQVVTNDRGHEEPSEAARLAQGSTPSAQGWPLRVAVPSPKVIVSLCSMSM